MPMSNEAAVWTRLESHGNEIHAIKERLAVGDHRHGQHEKQLLNICSQLKDTEMRMTEAIKEAGKSEKSSREALIVEIRDMKEKYEKLIAAYNEQQGAKKTLLIMPTILGVVVTILTLVNIFSGG